MIQYHFIYQVFDSLSKQNESDLSFEELKDGKHLQINNIITEFREKVSQLQITSSLNEYEFVKESILPKIENA